MPTRDLSLTQASLLCSRANAQFVYMLPLCSPMLARCSLVHPCCSLYGDLPHDHSDYAWKGSPIDWKHL